MRRDRGQAEVRQQDGTSISGRALVEATPESLRHSGCCSDSVSSPLASHSSHVDLVSPESLSTSVRVQKGEKRKSLYVSKNDTTTQGMADEQGQLHAYRTGTTSYYYLFDGAGNTVALTDSAGVVKNRYQYEPYGAIVTSGTSETVDNSFQFGGAYGACTDDETRLWRWQHIH